MAEHLGHGTVLPYQSPPPDDDDTDAWLRLDHVLHGHDHVDQAAIVHLNAQTRGMWQLSDHLPARTVMRAIVAHAENILLVVGAELRRRARNDSRNVAVGSMNPGMRP